MIESPAPQCSSIHITKHTGDNKKVKHILDVGLSIWDILEFIKDIQQEQDQILSIHMRVVIHKEGGPKSKIYYEVQEKRLLNQNNTFMFVFKNISSLKEMEKDKTTQKVNKMTYFQVTHELLTPLNSLLAMIEVIKNKVTDQDVLHYIKVCFCSSKQIIRTISEYQDLQ